LNYDRGIKIDEASHKKIKIKRCGLVTHVFGQLKNKIKDICGTY